MRPSWVDKEEGETLGNVSLNRALPAGVPDRRRRAREIFYVPFGECGIDDKQVVQVTTDGEPAFLMCQGSCARIGKEIVLKCPVDEDTTPDLDAVSCEITAVTPPEVMETMARALDKAVR